MSIILIGYMGSGKSIIGLELAKKMNYKFIDLDDYITDKEKSTIDTIFKNKGEIYFRKIENKYLKEIINFKKNYVLSVGGGTPCYTNNLDLIITNSITVYLKASIQTLFDRLVSEKGKRPLIKNLKAAQLKEFIAKHLFERSAFYDKASLIIDINTKTIKEIVREITIQTQ